MIIFLNKIFLYLEYQVSVPPVRGMSSALFKGKSQEADIEWGIAFPQVTFIYRNDDCDAFIGKLDYVKALEVFGVKKTANGNADNDALVKALSKTFDDKKVTVEVAGKNATLEIKGAKTVKVPLPFQP